MKKVLLVCCISLLLGMPARAETTINHANKYAYGANVGWGDFQGETNTGVVIGEFVCSGFAYFANVGWVDFGDGSPTNGFAYGNESPDDYGVNHDGAGNLSGFAYGANIGWINFEQTFAQPKIDLRTGALGGFAYGANVGWISLSNQFAFVQTDVLDHGPDSDADAIPDAWEFREAGGTGVLGGAPSDLDGDGMPDVEEYGADTDPNDAGDSLRLTALDVMPGSPNTKLSWSSRPTRFYRIEQAPAATNESAWVDGGPGLVAPDPGSETARLLPDATETTLYYRVQAVMPLWSP